MFFKIFMIFLFLEYNLFFFFGYFLNIIVKFFCRILLVKLNKDVLKVNVNFVNWLFCYKIVEIYLFYVFMLRLIS